MRITITNVRRVSYIHSGLVNWWAKVEYGDERNTSLAFFADSRLLGWGGVLGGTKQIYEALKHFNQ